VDLVWSDLIEFLVSKIVHDFTETSRGILWVFLIPCWLIHVSLYQLKYITNYIRSIIINTFWSVSIINWRRNHAYIRHSVHFVAININKIVHGVDFTDFSDFDSILKIDSQFLMSLALWFVINLFRQTDGLIGDLNVIHPSL